VDQGGKFFVHRYGLQCGRGDDKISKKVKYWPAKTLMVLRKLNALVEKKYGFQENPSRFAVKKNRRDPQEAGEKDRLYERLF
jgi:hypothetical protein